MAKKKAVKKVVDDLFEFKNLNTDLICDIAVVGSGAAGIMAAIIAAENSDKNIVILDHSDRPAAKILTTGNGRCNFTNLVQNELCYRSSTAENIFELIQNFDQMAVINKFYEMGMLSRDDEGYCYPRTNQASTVRDILLERLEQLGIQVYKEVAIKGIVKTDSGFEIDAKQGLIKCSKCIIATGGKSAKHTGCDGSGYIYARRLGHTIVETVPALCALKSDAEWLKAASGVRAIAKVTLSVNDIEVASDTGEVQFTDYGISGIPVFQISRFANYALKDSAEKCNTVKVAIDLMPDMEVDDLDPYIKSNGLRGVINSKLADIFTGSSADELKNIAINITGDVGFDRSQVTAGGVSMAEINYDTMESKLVKDLYFAGEILDVDGICGGYNLQWAWTSGYLSGLNAAK